MILSKAQYIASIEGLLPDNATQEISPLDLRTSLINLVDSVPLFFAGNELDSTNFATPDLRTTKAGELALSKMFLAGRSSVDNSAFGYATLRNNFDGSGNTAIGTYALSCNLYGDYNTAVGFQASVGNVLGSGNTALGAFSLNNNKNGDFNIGIGHGAGWYIGPDRDYTLSIGVRPVESDNVCDGMGDPLYSDDISPLIFGDLDPSSPRLGVATNTLHDFGALQVSGDASPSVANTFQLGRSQYPWAGINDFVEFDGDNMGIGGAPSGVDEGIPDGILTAYGDIVPGVSGRYALGHPSLTWDGYFNDVVISGQALINDAVYNEVTQCLYECKTLHLATSGFCDPDDLGFHNSAVCGFMTDESLDGAGFEIHSSGGQLGFPSYYRRDYRFIYRFPDPDVDCLIEDNAYSRSRFQTNISLQVTSGNHLQTDRVLSNNLRDRMSIVHQSGCHGVYMDVTPVSGNRITFGSEEHSNLDDAAFLDYNFVGRTGTEQFGDGDTAISGYSMGAMLGTADSGVKVIHRFASRISDPDTAVGFAFVYHDERDSSGEIDCDRLGYGDCSVKPPGANCLSPIS